MKMHPERNVKTNTYEDLGLMQLFRDQDLVSTVIGARPYSEEFVRDFYANLEPEIDDPTSFKYHLVYVRRIFEFCLDAINCFYVSGHDEDAEPPEFA